MIKELSIAVPPHAVDNTDNHRMQIAKQHSIKYADITGIVLQKRSIDARARQVRYQLKYKVYINEPILKEELDFNYKHVAEAKQQVVIIGAGPAGLFCALECLLLGIKPIVIERGGDVRARRRDLAVLNKQGVLNEESNYCFGEGGAGTYSDGKLYTRSGKRGSIEHILQQFVYFGAQQDILIDAHPHIGTNKLPHIIAAMREKILACAGEIHFNTKLTDIVVKENAICAIETNKQTIPCTQVVLATGHSARDIYELLHRKQILIEHKSLAIGVRVEHPQKFVDGIQYHCDTRGDFLPPASYSLVHQANGKGVFSFCMCPGGIIAPASVQHERLVVNGWSPSKRDNAYANSGIVVSVEEEDFKPFAKHGALQAMHYQDAIEAKAFVAGGGLYQAPAQRIKDFLSGKTSSSLPNCSYLPGLASADLRSVLPKKIHEALCLGFKAFNAKMQGYIQDDAVVVATESRTSSPVRIPRDAETLQHPQLQGLYPCGEGAGYAGGIVSAAIDGVRCARQAALQA
ncbi:MAG: hypothetical protein RL660_1836 [Bacteroidota bacterium]|jgi:uncharacterized FAD-dependent dehydrogenase